MRWPSSLVILLALGQAATIGVPSHAQAPAGGTMAATGRDFDAQKTQRLGAMNADLLCEHLFDSADPAAMLVELASIAGPGVMLGKLSEAAGQPVADQKKLYADLRVSARQKVWLPVAAEREVGQWMDQKYRKESLLVEPADLPRNQRSRFDVAKGLLDGIVATLPADSPYTFTLAVAQADESNASISPGGFVYVTTGMLQDKTLERDDFALRLSHEVAHLTRRHALKEIQVKAVDTLEITRSLRPLLDFTRAPASAMEALFGSMKASDLMFQRFGQLQELEGDACGAYLLVRQPGIDAPAAIRRFATSRAGTGEGRAWESSHPAPEERELVMTAQLDPAARARVTQLRAGGSPAGAAGDRPATGPTQAAPSEPAAVSLPPTTAGVQPSTRTNPVGSLLDKIRKTLP